MKYKRKAYIQGEIPYTMHDVEILSTAYKQKKRELAKAERDQRKSESELRLLKSVHARLSSDTDLSELNINQIVHLRTDLAKALSLAEPEEINKESWELLEILDTMIRIRRTLNLGINKAKRNIRIATNQAINSHECPPDETLCIVCQKRPRHFGDYCKRCVPESERPRGKVS